VPIDRGRKESWRLLRCIWILTDFEDFERAPVQIQLELDAVVGKAFEQSRGGQLKQVDLQQAVEQCGIRGSHVLCIPFTRAFMARLPAADIFDKRVSWQALPLEIPWPRSTTQGVILDRVLDGLAGRIAQLAAALLQRRLALWYIVGIARNAYERASMYASLYRDFKKLVPLELSSSVGAISMLESIAIRRYREDSRCLNSNKGGGGPSWRQSEPPYTFYFAFGAS